MIFLCSLFQFLFSYLQISCRSQIFPGVIFSSFLLNFKDEVVRDIYNTQIMLLVTASVDEVVKLDS
jgi:hypothetical protein